MDVEVKALEKEWLLRKKRKEYNETHREQIKIAYKKYLEKNRENVNTKKREWYQKNRDEIHANWKTYYDTHPEAKKRKKELQLRWMRANKDKIHDYYVEYRKTHHIEHQASKFIKGVLCPRCGFKIKCASRNSTNRSIKCPACKLYKHAADMKKIDIERETYKSVFDIQKAIAEKKEFEELVMKRLIEKGELSS
jgi:hypothetical protein